MLDLAGLAKWISKCSGDGTLKNTWILNTLINILNILNILNTLLKKKHFHLGDRPLIVSALKHFCPFVSLFYFCYTKYWVAMYPLGYPDVVVPVWYNTENYFFIYFIVTLIWTIRDSLSKLITGGTIRTMSSWRLCLLLFHYHSYIGSDTNSIRSLLINLHLFGHALKTLWK